MVRAVPHGASGAERARRDQARADLRHRLQGPGDAALDWIAALGDPYTRIGADSGQVGIDWGVYGVPETFLVDKTGHIRYKHVGPLTEADIENTILPLVARLREMTLPSLRGAPARPRRDAAISLRGRAKADRDCFAALAMTPH